MKIKDAYLSIETIDYDISLIKKDIETKISKSRKWEANLDQSALIITDLQNYFLDPDSHAFIPSAPAIFPNIKKLIGIFRDNDRLVIFTKHTNNQENAGSMDYWWNDLIKEDDYFSKLYGELDCHGDPVLFKHQYDAFYKTNLEDILIEQNVKYPVVCGVMTNLCCESTVRTAFVKGFRPVLPIDATAAYNRSFHIATFRNLSFGFSPLMTTDEVINKLIK